MHADVMLINNMGNKRRACTNIAYDLASALYISTSVESHFLFTSRCSPARDEIFSKNFRDDLIVSCSPLSFSDTAPATI